MSLGYALLHRNRIEVALKAEGPKKTFDEVGDVLLGALGAGDLGAGLEAFFEDQASAFEGLFESFQGLAEPDGPLSAFSDLFDFDLEADFDLGALFTSFEASLGGLDTGRLNGQLKGVADGLLAALPGLDGSFLAGFVGERLTALTAVLEQPLRGGRCDAGSHRAFRAAVTLRQLFEEWIAQLDVELDFKAAIHALIDRLTAELDGLGTARLAAAFGGLKAQFGGLLEALGNLSFEASVSVSVGGGAQGMAAEAPTCKDEVKAVPHTSPGLMWGFDLGTNVLALFHLIWELVRTRNWDGRQADGVLSFFGILWQAARTLIRAAWPEAVNKQLVPEDGEDPNSDGDRFLNWLFTDQGDFIVQIVLRFFAAFHEAGSGSNWVLSLGNRFLKYFTNVVNFRIIYLFARSWTYFDAWRAGGSPGRPAMNRVMFAVFPVLWIFAVLIGSLQPWDEYNLNETGGLTIGMIVLTLGLGMILGYIALWQLAGKNPFVVAFEPDWVSFGIFAATLILGTLLLLGVVLNVENDQTTGLLVAIGIFLGLFALQFLYLGLLFRDGSSAEESTFADVNRFALMLVTGFLGFAVTPFFTWWFTIDDGRDKLGLFDALDGAGSPYKLPYRADENWLCGQGPHGIFSHVPTSVSAHYAYDFNEYEDQPALVSRGGMVLDLRQSTENGEAPGNYVDLAHLGWNAANDPGSDLERVPTLSDYFHFSQNRIWADIGDRVVQGYHFADIDNTGISAQHHLHFGVQVVQDGTTRSIPFVFADSSLDQTRAYPLLSFIEGKGNVRGKPLALAYYTSENTEQDPVVNQRRMQLSTAGVSAHNHFLAIDRRALGSGALPATVTLFTSVDQGHYHSITLSREQLQQILALQVPAAVASSTVGGHSHLLAAHVASGRTSSDRAITVAQPPPGQLLAQRPGPYRLLGEQFAARINRRATEYFFYGALRPALEGDIALDRGLAATHSLQIDGTARGVPAGTTNVSVRGTARILSQTLRGAPLAVAVRALPVLVLETRRRGSAATLRHTGGSARLGRVQEGSGAGAGAFGDLGQISRAALASHFDDVLKNGWPAAPAGFNATVAGGLLRIEVGGAAVDLSASSARLAAVLTGLYDPTARQLRAGGAMPLATGRVAVDATFQPPVLAAPARIRLPLSGPAFTGDALTATPLVITSRGDRREVPLLAGDDAAAVAPRVMATAEGVRAWDDAGELVVETVAAGPAVALEVRKDGPGSTVATASSTGVSPALSAPGGSSGGGLADSAAVAPAELRAVLRDAESRATLPYDPVAVAPEARIDGGRLVLEVAAGHTLEVTGQGFPGPDAPFTFTRPEDRRAESQVLPDPLPLAGPSWVDLEIDGDPLRVPLDGEPARLDVGPAERLPAADETLSFEVDGGAVTVTFDGTEGNVAGVAAKVAAASSLVTVRLAYALSLENSLYQNPAHTLALAGSAGLALAGFLRDAAGLTTVAIGTGADHLQVPAALNGPRRTRGVPAAAFTLREEPAGSDLTWHLDAAPGFTLEVLPTPVDGEPLAFPTGAAAASVASQLLGETFNLGRACQNYRFELRDADNLTVAASEMQIAASPAVARTTAAATLPLPAAAPLTVTVLEPRDGLSDLERPHNVELGGAASLDEVAEQLNTAAPAIRAWVAPVAAGGVTLETLHLETRGRGSGWGLRLDNPLLLLALGFDFADLDPVAETLTATGGGVRDGRAVSRAELRRHLEGAVAGATGLVEPGGASARALQVETSGTGLVLRSLEGAVTVESRPPSLRDALAVSEAPGQTTLSPASPVALDSGTIVVKAAGRTLAAAEIFAGHASLRAAAPLPDAASAEGIAMLGLLKAHELHIHVDGADVTSAPVPASAATFEETVQHIASQGPGAWIGLVADTAAPAERHVVLQSRGRGTARTLAIDFSQFNSLTDYPADTLLGFEAAQLADDSNPAGWRVGAAGSGNVDDPQTIAVQGGAADTLESLLRDAAARGAARQSVYDVEADSAAAPPALRLRANVAAWTLLQTVIPPRPPGSPALPAGVTEGPVPADLRLGDVAGTGAAAAVLEAAYPGAPAAEPGLVRLVANPGVARQVRALVAGNAARLPVLELPGTLTVLDGAGFDVGVGAELFPVVLAAPPGVTAEELAAQVERQCGWRVRAESDAAGLAIETVEAGSAPSLGLNAPAAATPSAVTGDLATGMRAPVALPLLGQGSGTVPSLEAVALADMQSVLQDAFLAEIPAADQADRGSRTLNWQAYEVPPATVPASFTLTSQRSGCLSAVELIYDEAPSLALGRGFERGPAARGSVALPAFAGTKTLPEGTLWIELNDTAAVADLAPTEVVGVEFAAGDLTAEQVAERIHEVLFGRGAGQAAAYADGTVVVETAVPGLAGSVRIPAPGAAPSAADQALADALVGAGTVLEGRGWPGAGVPGTTTLSPGYRSRPEPARAAAQWTLSDGTTTVTVNVAAGQSLEEVQGVVESALAAAPARIAVCLMGTDGTLYIEGTGAQLDLTVDGAALAVTDVDPKRPGTTPERAEEPALGLRRTDETRTYRFLRDRGGDGVVAEMDDLGWLRVPANISTDAAPGAPSSPTFVPGRHLMAVRPDAAKATGYDAGGEMIAAAGTDPADDQHHLVHRARYWIGFQDGRPLRLARLADGTVLVDLLWGG